MEDGVTYSMRHDHVDLVGGDRGLAFGERLGSAVFIPDLASEEDRAARWRLELTDRAGRVAVVERTVVPTRAAPPPP